MKKYRFPWKIFVYNMILLSSCDPVHNLYSEPFTWKITKPPKEVICIKGDSHAFPTLDQIIITRKESTEEGRLILLSNTTIPDSSFIENLFSIPIDSLYNQNYIFDQETNGFYSIALFTFLEGQESKSISLTKPITYPENYIFGVADLPELYTEISFEFHRLGNDNIPIIEVISIE